MVRQPQIQAMMMSRCNIYEFSEKPSKYFLNLEKRNYINKLLSRIDTGNEILTDQCKILEVKRFYKNLYTTKRKTPEIRYLEQFLKLENIKKLTLEEKNICEGPVKDIELKQVLRNMNNGMSPGSVNFLQSFKSFSGRI